MRSRFASTTALSVAFALTVTLTGAVAPAFASTPRPDIIPTNPIVTAPIGPLPQPGQEPATVTFQPDIRVNYLNKSNGSGGKVTYRFRVQNIGAASASNVGLGTSIRQLANDGSVATDQSGSGGSIPTLGQDQSKEITITCTPLPGYHCDGATLQAYLNNDLNPANNKATGE